MSFGKPPIEPGRVMSIGKLSEDLAGSKVRLAGRVIVFEQHSQHLLLESNHRAIWVDVSLCLDPAAPNSLPFLRESKSIITVIGYIQISAEKMPDYPLPSRALDAAEPETETSGIHPHLLCEAIIARNADGLDLDDWERTVALREAALMPSIRKTQEVP